MHQTALPAISFHFPPCTVQAAAGSGTRTDHDRSIGDEQLREISSLPAYKRHFLPPLRSLLVSEAASFSAEKSLVDLED